MQNSFLGSYRVDADRAYCIGGQIQMCELFPLFLSLTVPQTAERALSLWPGGSASCANMAHSCNISHRTTGLLSRKSQSDLWCPGSLGWDTFHVNDFSQTYRSALQLGQFHFKSWEWEGGENKPLYSTWKLSETNF